MSDSKNQKPKRQSDLRKWFSAVSVTDTSDSTSTPVVSAKEARKRKAASLDHSTTDSKTSNCETLPPTKRRRVSTETKPLTGLGLSCLSSPEAANSSSVSSCDDSDSDSVHSETAVLWLDIACLDPSIWSRKVVPLLSTRIHNTRALIQTLFACYQLGTSSCNGSGSHFRPNANGLRQLVSERMTASERLVFFNVTLPFIQRSALRLPTHLKDATRIKLLRSGVSDSVEFTQSQVCSLLAALLFFGLFQRADSHSQHSEHCEMPPFTLWRLFGADTCQPSTEKLKCIIHYFHALAIDSYKQTRTLSSTSDLKSRTQPIFAGEKIEKDNESEHSGERIIRIHRRVLTAESEFALCRDASLQQNDTELTKLTVFGDDVRVEDCEDCIQVDFANESIGGGVFGRGCVMEEILFAVSTECLVSMLVCEKMKTNECIAICGVKLHSQYRGYASSFRFNSHLDDAQSHCILAIDALRFAKETSDWQFEAQYLQREVLKAYTGFSVELMADSEVATGNWGAGVFNGDLELKCALQWIAATLAGRSLKYCPFGDKRSVRLRPFVQFVESKRFSVSTLWKAIFDYRTNVLHKCPPSQRLSLFEFVMSSLS